MSIASQKAREGAIANGDSTYIGKPCKQGHPGVRYVRKSACVECRNEERKKSSIKWTARFLKTDRGKALNAKNCAKWRIENKEKYNNIIKLAAAKRRAIFLNSIPHWLSDSSHSAIKKIYSSCPSGMAVDHIVPLNSKLVCGLHVPWNLQYLSISENSSKGNRWWPDDWNGN